MEEQNVPLTPKQKILFGLFGVVIVVAAAIVWVISPAPTVHGMADGKTVEIHKESAFTFVFDQPMDHLAVERAFTIAPYIAGQFSWEGNTVTFDPAYALEKGATFNVTIGKGARNWYWKGLAGSLVQSFYVRNDPEVSVVAPTGGATVRPAQILTVLFDRPMRVLTGSLEVPEMLAIQPSIEGEYHWLGTSGFEFVPTEGWAPATTYTVTLPKTIVLQDGSSLMEDYVWSFQTPNLSVTLLSSATQMRPKEPVSLQFNYPINPATVRDAITIYGQTIPGVGEPGTASSPTALSKDAFQFAADPKDANTILITKSGGWSLGNRYQFVLPENFQGGLGPNGLVLTWTQDVSMDELGFRMLKACPGSGGTKPVNHSVVFVVNNPADEDTFAKAVRVSPTLEDMEVSAYGYAKDCENARDNAVSIYGDWKPSTTYTITISRDLTDIYGQVLASAQTYTVTTDPYPPSAELSGYESQGVLASHLPRIYQVRVLNMAKPIVATLCRVSLVAFMDQATGGCEQIGQREYDTSQTLNQYKIVNVDLDEIAGSRVSTGMYRLELKFPGITYYGDSIRDRVEYRHLLVTDTALTMKQDKAGNMLAWATDLKTGDIVPNLTMELLTVPSRNATNGTVVATSSTDVNGIAKFSANPNDNYSYSLRASGGERFGYVSEGWADGVSPWNFGLEASYGTNLTNHIGYLYTDRRIYRPDQTVYFKGVVRKDVDAALSLPGVSTVDVVFTDPNGTKITTQSLPLSAYGTFNGSILLDPSMALGTYSFSVAIAGQGMYGSFSVLEYRRPDFKVSMDVPTDATGGDTIQIPVTAEYYYGGSLANATVDYAVTRRGLYFQPMRGEWYSFSERDDSYCYWYCGSEEEFENVKSGSATLDANGTFTLSLPSSLTDYKSSATYLVTATVTDVNQRQVSSNAEFNVHKGEFYLGIRPDYTKGWSAPNADFDVTSVTHDGSILPNTSGTVTLYKRTWASVQKEGTNSNAFREWVKTDTFVDRAAFVTDGEAKAEVSFAPAEDGTYVAVASAIDASGNTITASVTRWVDRGGRASIRVTDDHTMKIVQNKADYAVGDVASLMVETPYEHTKALLTIERDTIRETRVIDLGSANRTIEIPITEDMTPNVYVSVLAAEGGGEGNPEFRLGYANLQVNTTTKILTMEVTPDKTVYRPGETVNLTVTTKRSNGAGAAAEVSIAVVDERVVALLGSIDKDILGRFWFPRTIGVFTSQTLTQLVKLVFADTEGGAGKGGGDDTSTVRGNFQDTAFWKADIVTDASGNGKVSFKLPDNLTTWQILAIGATKDTVVGTAVASAMTRLDLMVEPTLPRIVRMGDTLTFGALIANVTDNPILARVNLTATGVDVLNGTSRMVALPANSRQPVRWNVSVPMDSKEVYVSVQAEGGGLSDGFEVTVPVLGYAVPETVSASNAFGRDARETIEIPEDILPGVGEVKASVTTNVGTGLAGSFDYLAKFEYGCSEQTASALVGGLMYRQLVASRLIVGDEELDRRANDKIEYSIKRLVSTQRPSGGWGFWADSHQDYPFVTAYAFWSLTQAQQATYLVDDATLDRADAYLRNYLAAPIDDTYRGLGLNERAQVLFMLAERNPDNLSGYAATLYEQRTELTLFGKAFLAMALHKIDGNITRATTVLNDVKNGVIYENASTAYVTEDSAYNDYFMNSDIRSTSLYLQALLRISPKSDDVDRLVRYLMTAKIGGYWYNTQNTAMVLKGLTDYVKRHPVKTDSLDVQIYLDQALSSTLTFENGDLSGERSVTYSIDSLLASGNTHTFDFKKDSEKRYYYDLSYTIFRQIEDIKPFDNGLTVLADIYALDDLKHERPLTSIAQGENVRVHMKLLVPKEHRYVSFEYHLPAGLEAVDFSLKTSPQYLAGVEQQCVPDWSGETYCLSDWEMGWWWENVWTHTEQRDDRVFLFTEWLHPGIYDYDFVATAVTPGEFRVPPARAYEFYNPLANGHNEGKLFKVLAP